MSFLGEIKRRKVFHVAAAYLVVASPASAHHGNIIFDLDRVVTLQGTVSRYVWRNPHVYVYVEVSDSEMAERRKAWTAPPLKATKGTLYRYIKDVTSATEGCVTDE